MYDQALESFDYWSFPFSCVLTQHLKKQIDDQIEHKDLIISERVRVLDQLLKIMNKSEIENNNPKKEKYIKRFEFDRMSPFYQWSSEFHSLEINRLLSGEETTFYADISSAKFDVIKFSKLNLHIEILSNRSSNETLHNLLETNFFVDLTYMGPSFPKFRSKVVKINFIEQLLFSFKYGSNSLDESNEAFKKLESSEPKLIPYTFWKIKL